MLVNATNEESNNNVVLKVDINKLPVSLHTHQQRVCLIALDVLFCNALESFYQMVDRGKIILVEQVNKQFNNNYPVLLRSLPRLLNVYTRITEEILLNYKKVDIKEIQSLMHVIKDNKFILISNNQIVSDSGPYSQDSHYSIILKDNTVYAKALFNEIKEMLTIPYIMPAYVSNFGTQEQYDNTILRLKNLHIYELIIDICNPPKILLIPIAMLSLTLTRSLFENICLLKSNIVENNYQDFCDNISITVNFYNGCKNYVSYSINKEARDKLYQSILALIINFFKFRVDISKVHKLYTGQINQFELFCRDAWYYYEENELKTFLAIQGVIGTNL